MFSRTRVLFLLAVPVALCATPISGLNNTGLAPQQTADPNWTINGGAAFVTQTGVFPFNGFWTPDQTTSGWISPQPTYAGGSGADPDGVFDYSTTFTLGEFNPSATWINFTAAADNLLVDVKLNGVSIGATLPMVLGFSFEPSLTIDSGFVVGLNHLDFMVSNFKQEFGNPTGLQVQFQSSTAAPEPEFTWLIGAGLLVLWFANRKIGASKLQ